ncbi:MAG: (4Fe-4S)-binding protein [Saprospiraceae bacterium]|nr:(4Fe-4S)-binding protein [Saprospiraceae bacterium]
MDDTTKKEYSNGEVTIVWKPSVCIHSTLCWKGEDGLKSVFNPSERPWIKPEGATTDKIINQVKKCPSGALSYYMNNEPLPTEKLDDERLVETRLNGPLMVHGSILVKDHQGNEIQKSNVTAFCRCGASKNKPFCDGTHRTSGFEG